MFYIQLIDENSMTEEPLTLLSGYDDLTGEITGECTLENESDAIDFGNESDRQDVIDLINGSGLNLKVGRPDDRHPK